MDVALCPVGRREPCQLLRSAVLDVGRCGGRSTGREWLRVLRPWWSWCLRSQLAATSPFVAFSPIRGRCEPPSVLIPPAHSIHPSVSSCPCSGPANRVRRMRGLTILRQGACAQPPRKWGFRCSRHRAWAWRTLNCAPDTGDAWTTPSLRALHTPMWRWRNVGHGGRAARMVLCSVPRRALFSNEIQRGAFGMKTTQTACAAPGPPLRR